MPTSEHHHLALEADEVIRRLEPPDRARLAELVQVDHYVAGTRIVREGARDRAMYFVLSGEARVRRGPMELDIVRAGEHFGELALLADRPRAATVVAASDVRVARLDHEGYQALAQRFPETALRLVTCLVDDVAGLLERMTDSVGSLLEERSLPRRVAVLVRIGDQTHEVGNGTQVRSLLPSEVDGRAVVAALLDRRAVSLTARVASDCELAPVSTATWEGRRVYRTSIGLLLLEAAYHLDPKLQLSLGSSVGFGQRVSVRGRRSGNRAVLAQELAATMEALDGQLREEIWTVEEARAHFRERGWTEAADYLGYVRDDTVRLATYGSVYVLDPGPLLPHTREIRGFRVIPDQTGLLLVYGPRAAPNRKVQVSGASEARAVSRYTHGMTREHRRWLDALGITSIGAFNRACVGGDVTTLIRVAEGFHEKRVGQLADAVAREKKARLVCVAGPSSSGKTTFISRLKTQLEVNGIRPIGLSLDDYYVNRVDTPRDADGQYDFEALEALKLDLLGEHLRRLLAGETVKTSRYDFQTGVGDPAGGPEVALDEGEVLLIEGIHGINPRLLASLPADTAFRIFVCPLAQLPIDRLTRVHASDVRLLRRIVRDRHGRGHDAAATIRRWPSVRRGERLHIYPQQHHADAVFDSSLIYELSVLKVFAERYLLEVPEDGPAYATAFRLLRLLGPIVTIYPDHVPPTSILREFIGSGGYEF